MEAVETAMEKVAGKKRPPNAGAKRNQKRRFQRRLAARQAASEEAEVEVEVEDVKKREGLPTGMWSQLKTGLVWTLKVLCMGEDGTQPYELAQPNRHVKRRGTCFKSLEESESTDPLRRRMYRLPQVVSQSPPEWVGPSAELIAKVEALESWEELFCPLGRISVIKDAVERAGELDREAGSSQRKDYPGDVVLAMGDYSEVSREVLKAGFTLWVDAEGRPHITTLEKVTVNMETELMKARARAAGVRDEDGLTALDWGARSRSETPEVCVYSQNHNGAVQHKEVVTDHLESEVKAGFVVASRFPPSIPLCVRPMSMVPKLKAVEGVMVITGWRLVVDASYPGKRTAGAKVIGADGTEKFVAPNHNFEGVDEKTRFNWCCLSVISHGFGLLLAVSAFCGVPLVGQCFDFKGWFRQIGMSTLDRWQVVEAWGGAYYHDARVAMGCSFSADIAQRVAFFVCEILEAKLRALFPAFLAAQDGTLEWVRRLKEWLEMRKTLFPGDPREWKVWCLFSYQDDTPTGVLQPLAKWLDETIRGELAELGVELSGKEKGFETEFEAIGGAFEFFEGGVGRLGPGASTLLDFGADVAEIRRCFEEGVLVDAPFFESFKGRYEWVGRFLVNGPERTCPAHRCWAQHWLFKRKGVKVSKALMDSVVATEWDLREKNFAPMEQEAQFWHGGWLMSGDASTKDGWGVVNHDVGLAGLWEEATKEAIQRSKEKEKVGDRVSISPLELMTVAFLLCLVMETSGPTMKEKRGTNGVLQLVMRCDNQSAVDVMVSRRPHSPAMREALSIVEMVEAHYAVRVRLEHITSEDNVIADALSHDDWGKAIRLMGLAGCELRKAPEEMKGPIDGLSFKGFALECERRVCKALSLVENEE